VLAEDGVHLTQQVHTMPSQDTRAKSTRRRHDAAFKSDLIERSLQPGASVSAIALENGINANLLFKWRRMHLRAASRVEGCGAAQAALLPVKLALAQEAPAYKAARPSTTAMAAGVIEIDIGAARVRLRGAVDEANVRCVLQALSELA
jgi:transposase